MEKDPRVPTLHQGYGWHQIFSSVDCVFHVTTSFEMLQCKAINNKDGQNEVGTTKTYYKLPKDKNAENEVMRRIWIKPVNGFAKTYNGVDYLLHELIDRESHECNGYILEPDLLGNTHDKSKFYVVKEMIK